MRRLEILIDLARELSQNTRYDANSGVSQKLFVQFFQAAQDAVVKGAVNAKTKFFLTEKIVPVVNGQETYSYPSDIYMQNIDTVEWSQDGVDGWNDLDRCITKDRFTSKNGYAFGYWTRNDGIHVTPTLDNGFLRINYIAMPPRLEKRSGLSTQFNAAPTPLGPGAVLTSISTDSASLFDDPTYLAQYDFISTCGADGEQKIKAIPISSATVGTVSVPSYTLGDGEYLAVGDYLLAGKNSTNQSVLPDICESLFLKYVNYVAKYGDSSTWSTETKADMAASLSELLDSFKLLTDDITYVPITNVDFLSMW